MPSPQQAPGADLLERVIERGTYRRPADGRIQPRYASHHYAIHTRRPSTTA